MPLSVRSVRRVSLFGGLAAIAVSAAVFGAVVFGMHPGVLLYALPGGLPLGTALTAAAFAGASGAAFALSRPRTALRAGSIAALVCAAVWLPAGLWLSGGPTLSFPNDVTAHVFAGLTTATLALTLGALSVALADAVRRLTRTG